MTIQIGDTIPEVNIKHINDGIETVDTVSFFEGKKLVLFSVPGAFTPTCSEKHLPGFIEHFEAFREKGVGVACMSVNDVFVMDAWGKDRAVGDKVLMLADGNGDFTKALGLELDASGFGICVAISS